MLTSVVSEQYKECKKKNGRLYYLLIVQIKQIQLCNQWLNLLGSLVLQMLSFPAQVHGRNESISQRYLIIRVVYQIERGYDCFRWKIRIR